MDLKLVHFKGLENFSFFSNLIQVARRQLPFGSFARGLTDKEITKTMLPLDWGRGIKIPGGL